MESKIEEERTIETCKYRRVQTPLALCRFLIVSISIKLLVNTLKVRKKIDSRYRDYGVDGRIAPRSLSPDNYIYNNTLSHSYFKLKCPEMITPIIC